MKWLILKQRILVLEAIDDYAIYKPMKYQESVDGLVSQNHTVKATGKHIVPNILYEGTQERCEAFVNALGRCLNIETDAIPIGTILSAMEPEKGESNV